MTYKIIGVEDSATIRCRLESIFEEAGHVYEGVEAWSEFNPLLLKNPDANLLLIDLNLTTFDGGDLIKIIKKHYKNLAPILILSNEPEEKLKESVRSSGADGYVQKKDLKNLLEDLESYLPGINSAALYK